MATIEDRIKDLARRHLNLERDLNPEAGLHESDVSSADVVAFIKRCGEEFNVTLPPEVVAEFKNLRDLATYIDSHAG